MRLGRLGLSFVISGKLHPEDYVHLTEVNEVKPCCGRNWWYWYLKLSSNLMGREDKIERLQLRWLCFALDIEWWPMIADTATERSEGED